MTLLETLSARRRLRSSDIRLTDELDAAVAAVSAAFPGYNKTSAQSVQQILLRLTHSIRNWEWADITVGQVTTVVRAWLTNQAAVLPFVEDFLRIEIAVSTNVALLQAVCDSYLEEWSETSQRTVWVREILKSKLSLLPGNWQRVFTALPELLQEENGPDSLAERMALESDPYSWLVKNGVGSPHSGDFMAAAHSSFLRRMAPVESIDRIEVVFRWILPEGRLPMENGPAASAVDVILRSWANRNPGPEIRIHLLNRIMAFYGDPRNQKPEFWSLVTNDSRKVVVRWLAGQSMDALLRIIGDATQNHMWESRHVFWKGLYDRGLIDEAWIVLSAKAIRIADKLLKETQNPIYSMVSRQTARGDKKETCLLIMRIRNYIVLEGSHDYRVHVFDQSDPLAPTFYEEAYNAEAMRLPANDKNTKIHDQFGAWRQWVEKRVL